MRKVLMTQAMTENGISRFDGLYDENGFPVTAELEKNEDGKSLRRRKSRRSAMNTTTAPAVPSAVYARRT